MAGNIADTYTQISKDAQEAFKNLKEALLKIEKGAGSSDLKDLLSTLTKGGPIAEVGDALSALGVWGAAVSAAFKLIGLIFGSGSSQPNAFANAFATIDADFKILFDDIQALDRQIQRTLTDNEVARSVFAARDISARPEFGDPTDSFLNQVNPDTGEPATNLTLDGVDNAHFASIFLPQVAFNHPWTGPLPPDHNGANVYEYRCALPALLLIIVNRLSFFVTYRPDLKRHPSVLEEIRSWIPVLQAHYDRINGAIVTLSPPRPEILDDSGKIADGGDFVDSALVGDPPAVVFGGPGRWPTFGAVGAVEKFSAASEVASQKDLNDPRDRGPSSDFDMVWWNIATARRRKILALRVGLGDLSATIASLNRLGWRQHYQGRSQCVLVGQGARSFHFGQQWAAGGRCRRARQYEFGVASNPSIRRRTLAQGSACGLLTRNATVAREHVQGMDRTTRAKDEIADGRAGCIDPSHELRGIRLL
jgi:hypothetical protein